MEAEAATEDKGCVGVGFGSGGGGACSATTGSKEEAGLEVAGASLSSSMVGTGKGSLLLQGYNIHRWRDDETRGGKGEED